MCLCLGTEHHTKLCESEWRDALLAVNMEPDSSPVLLSPAHVSASATRRVHFSYIYIYAFSRRFYPKRLTVHSGYTFVLSVCVFPGNRTHNLCAANAMLYHWATGTLFQTLVSSLLVVILTPPHRFQVELISVCDHECLFSEIQSTIYLRRTSAIWVSLPVYCKKPLRRNQRASW